MKKVLAIAGMGVRAAVRSRVVMVLLGMLLLAIVVLPLSVKGDGTLAGDVRILLSYTMGLVQVILAVATVWAGSAAVSVEVEQRQIHLVLAKPVSRGQVWLGKWLGLVAINVALLVLSGAVVYGLLRWNTRPGRLTAEQGRQLREQILVASRRVLPDNSELEKAARRFVEQQIKTGNIPKEVSPEEVFEVMRDNFLRQASTLPAGAGRRWLFKLPGKRSGDAPLTVRYQFSSSKTEKVAVDCIWVFGPVEAADRHQVREKVAAGKPHTVSVPARYVGSDGTLVAEFGNVNETPVTVLFDPKEGVELLATEGGFEANMGRTLAVVGCQLAFLAALAVTLGSLSSLPVAAFVTGSVVVLMSMGSHIEAMAQAPERSFVPGEAASAEPAQAKLFRVFAKSVAMVLKPLEEENALESLTEGRLVGWGWVAHACGVKVVVYGGVMAGVGTWFFNRREIGLPAT